MFRFTSRAAAWAFALHGRKNAVAQDDGRFWVVTLARAARLERDGYSVEYTPR